MKNNDFSLQLLTHKQIFANREDAVTYFEDNFKPYALAGEPAIAFYGDEKSPKAIIAIGTSTDKRIFFIDVEELSEQIKALDEASKEEKEEIADAVDLIKNIISACGLTFDENKKTNRITYEPDIKDEVICDAKSLGEAINLISKFVQKGFKDSALKVEDTDTIKLVYTDSEDGGKLLKANVKLSESGDSDDVDFNDNIICKKSDGIYAIVKSVGKHGLKGFLFNLHRGDRMTVFRQLFCLLLCGSLVKKQRCIVQHGVIGITADIRNKRAPVINHINKFLCGKLIKRILYIHKKPHNPVITAHFTVKSFYCRDMQHLRSIA